MVVLNMAARNSRIEPGWGLPDDEETFQKHREKVEDAARELASHDVDDAIQTLQREHRAIKSGEYFDDGYEDDTTPSRQVDRLREDLKDAILELVQHSFEGTLNTIGLEIKKMKARKRLQREREAFRRMKPERKEKAREKLREARKQSREE